VIAAQTENSMSTGDRAIGRSAHRGESVLSCMRRCCVLEIWICSTAGALLMFTAVLAIAMSPNESVPPTANLKLIFHCHFGCLNVLYIVAPRLRVEKHFSLSPRILVSTEARSNSTNSPNENLPQFPCHGSVYPFLGACELKIHVRIDRYKKSCTVEKA